jgi:hypothetical protein
LGHAMVLTAVDSVSHRWPDHCRHQFPPGPWRSGTGATRPVRLVTAGPTRVRT